MEQVRIVETTQRQVNGVLVGAGNIFADEFVADDGSTQSVLHVTLSLYDPTTDEEHDLRLRAGQKVELGGAVYQLESVDNGPNNRGAVVLARSN